MESMKRSPAYPKLEKIRELFGEISEMPEFEQKSLLDDICKNDPALYKELESLLKFASTGEEFHVPDWAQEFRKHLFSTVNEIANPCHGVEMPKDPNAAQCQDRNGQTVGTFQILECIGQGGMGAVYRAWDSTLRRTVALKFLTTDIDRKDESKQRFLREAQTASVLEHPNIASVHEIGETNDHQLYIVMGYYPGNSLRKILKSGPLPLDKAVNLGTQLACGVAAAHAHDIIHRDIKPDNIIINESGELRLLDFGLAKFTDSTKPTRDGGIMGTVAYMSPELIRNGIFTTKSDIWSIGVVLYEMLTGQNPFNRDNEASTIYSILKGDPIQKASSSQAIPSGLRQILKRCLTKDEHRRYASAEELLADLKKLVTAAPAKKPRLSFWQYSLAILVSIAIGISTSWVYHEWIRAKAPTVKTSPIQPAEHSITVLPFVDVSPSGGNSQLAAGIHEEILANLRRMRNFQVVPLRSTTPVSPAVTAPPQVTGELGVRFVLEGTIREDSGSVRIRAKLLDTASNEYIWAESYNQKVDNISQSQSEIAKSIALALKEKLTG